MAVKAGIDWVGEIDYLGEEKIMKKEKRELREMPFDRAFHTENGVELCHATGYEIKFEDGIWWNEYVDSEGCLHYGN